MCSRLDWLMFDKISSRLDYGHFLHSSLLYLICCYIIRIIKFSLHSIHSIQAFLKSKFRGRVLETFTLISANIR